MSSILSSNNQIDDDTPPPDFLAPDKIGTIEAQFKDSLDVTAKLLDEEKKKESERRSTISRITYEIENILLREDITMGEFLQIMDLFNSRANSVFSQTKLKDIKDNFNKF